MRMRALTEAQTLHRAAMQFSEEAMLETTAGRHDRARELFAKAFERAARAADLIGPFSNLEPTRSILYRSAASLAIDCGDYRAAQRLIRRGLAGSPPPELRAELLELMRQIRPHANIKPGICGGAAAQTGRSSP